MQDSEARPPSSPLKNSRERALKVPQALKRGHTLNDLAARVELVPFPNPPPNRVFPQSA